MPGVPDISRDALFDLSGKTAIVTGGAGIIGSRVARGFASFGASVAIADLDADAAEATAKDIAEDTGAEVFAAPCDVGDPDSVGRMVDAVMARGNGIQVLHNNAASKSSDPAAFFAPFEEFSLETWRETTRINLDGMFLVAQAVGREMAAAGAGSIIQTASIYGVVGADQRIYAGAEYEGLAINTPAVYSATKAAVLGLTRHLAAYWGPKGLRVNSLTPGGVESGQNETFKAAYGSRTPLGRMAERDEMVGAAVFLASDAANYVTGHNLVVDGGWTAW